MKQLDILFIHPNASEEIYQELSKDYSAIEPPIWAGMLTSHCLKHGFGAEILDCEAMKLDDAQATETIRQLNPRVVCFVVYGQQPSASSQNMEGAVSLAEYVKNHCPGIKILFVGGHVSALSREVMEKHPFVDMVCQNEGVYTISNLLRTNLKDKLNLVNGLGYREGGQIVLNKPSPIVEKKDLPEELPGMAWDKIPMGKYRTALWHSLPNQTEKLPFASLYTSLGCPMKCSFCMINIINRQENEYADGSAVFRYWEPEFIIKEFDKLAQLGIQNIKIADELFVLNPNHFMKLCQLIIERGYKFNIWCYSRVDTVRDVYLETMKKAGINFVALGIESGNTSVRKDVTKGRFEDVDIRDIVIKIQAAGINVAANYIFGLPKDNFQTMQNTLDLALELNTEMANFYSAMAYPGSPLYGIARKEGWKLPETYAGYSQHSYYTQPLPTKYLTAEQVLEFRDQAWTTYHTSPKFLALLKEKFGQIAMDKTLQSTKIRLRRKILEKEKITLS